MVYPDTAEGFLIHDHKQWSEFKKEEFPLKTFGDHDIDIAIDACGVCSSDVHTINGGWGGAPLPLCVGHEVIGRAIKVGKDVNTVKVGDRVGVGAQIQSCRECVNCKSDQENYCPHGIDTYGATYSDGIKSMGGYASHIRSHEYFTFKIPDNISTSEAAPMMCAGLTTYSPLVRLGAGPGKKVAIIGMGGLGHYAVLFGVALGAEIYVLSHSPNKKEDAYKMGAKEFIYTGDKGWHKKYPFNFDFIINCTDATHQFDLPAYFSTLKVMGKFHNVGFGDKPLPTIQVQDFAPNGCYIGASHIGNRPEMLAMLELVSKQNIHSWVSTIPISAEGCKEAVERVSSGKDVRYRLVLNNYDEVFGKRA